MMQMRPEVHPGEFKLIANQAGNTKFLAPKLVRGTLLEGARRLHDVEPGLARALYAMLLVAEVHPFNAGLPAGFDARRRPERLSRSRPWNSSCSIQRSWRPAELPLTAEKQTCLHGA